MKITSNIENNDNVIEILEELQKKHDLIYWETINGSVYIYKPLGRKDFNDIVSSEEADITDKEDEVILRTLLYPKPDEVFFKKIKAGTFTRLLDFILESSHMREKDIVKRVKITNAFRAEMFDLQNQVTCVIHEAFPEFSLDEIENWGIERTCKYLSRAEWVLINLRNLEVNPDLAEAAMSGNIEKYKEMMEEEQAIAEAKEKLANESNDSDDEISVQSNKKLALTPEKLQEMKAKYPEIAWEDDDVMKNGAAALNDRFVQSPGLEPI